MYSSNQCYICKQPSYLETTNKIDICTSCKEEFPYLSEGFQTNWTDREFRDEISVLGHGIGWYPLAGFDSYASDTRDGQKFAWSELTWDNPPEPQTALEELEESIRAVGLERPLTYLLAHEVHTEYINEVPHLPPDNSGLPAQMSWFGFGFAMMLSGDIDTSALENPEKITISKFPREYQEIVQSLHKIIAAFGSLDFLQKEVGINPDEEDSDRVLVSQAVQNRELVVSRIAFFRQYLQAMERQYTPFQVEFFRHYDIDILSSVEWSQRLVDELENWCQELITHLIKYQNSCIRIVGGYKQAVNEDRVEDAQEYSNTNEYQQLRLTAIANWNLVIQFIRTEFWLTKDELQSTLNISITGYFNRFLDKIVTEVGTGSLESPYKHNQMDEAPLIKMDGYHLIPYIPRLTYALSQRFYYLLTDCEDDLDRDLGDTWGDIIELWVTSRLSQILSDDQFAHSIDYEHPEIGDGEIDALVKVENRLLVIEVKSKRLRQKSRVGALDEIEADVSSNEGIGKAVEQLRDAISALKDVEEKTIIDELPFEITPDTIEEYESMVVTATQYDELATRMSPILFDEYDTEDLPYVCSVYDIDAIVEVLSDAELIEYVSNRRVELKKQRAFAAGDEVDFLEAFKANVLKESAYSLPPKEEADLFDVDFIRSIYNIDAGVHKTLGAKYGLSFYYPVAVY